LVKVCRRGIGRKKVVVELRQGEDRGKAMDIIRITQVWKKEFAMRRGNWEIYLLISHEWARGGKDFRKASNFCFEYKEVKETRESVLVSTVKKISGTSM